METSKKKNIVWTILLIAAGATLTVAGFIFIPPLIQKYGNKAYKAIHCIWYCINTASNRIEPEEIQWLRELSMDNQITQVPIIIVLTQSFSKKKAQEMGQLLLNENLDVIQLIPVLAEDYEIENLGIAKSYGLDVLNKVLGEALPEELLETLQHVQIACL